MYYSFYKRHKKRNNENKETDSFSSITLFNEIPEKIMRKIIKKIKTKAIIFYANRNDCNQHYNSEEFWTTLAINEDLIFDDSFFKECSEKKITSKEELENYKKQYSDSIINEVKMKQNSKKMMIDNFSEEILSKFEKSTVQLFKYTQIEYHKSLKFYLSINQYK